MSLAEKYRPYLVASGAPEHKPLNYNLSAAGWKLLVRENLSPILRGEMGLKQIGDYIWASDYEDGRRRAVSFFFINSAFATLEWGWNFRFIPKLRGNKVTWARTDKTIYMHLHHLSPSFYGSDYRDPKKMQAYDRVMMSRYGIDAKRLEADLDRKIREHRETLQRLLPEMKDYFAKTDTVEKTLRMIEADAENGYYRFMYPEQAIVKVFLEYYLGRKTEALAEFDEIPFREEEIKGQVYRKLVAMEQRT